MSQAMRPVEAGGGLTLSRQHAVRHSARRLLAIARDLPLGHTLPSPVLLAADAAGVWLALLVGARRGTLRPPLPLRIVQHVRTALRAMAEAEASAPSSPLSARANAAIGAQLRSVESLALERLRALPPAPARAEPAPAAMGDCVCEVILDEVWRDVQRSSLRASSSTARGT